MLLREDLPPRSPSLLLSDQSVSAIRTPAANSPRKAAPANTANPALPTGTLEGSVATVLKSLSVIAVGRATVMLIIAGAESAWPWFAAEG